MLSFFQGPEAEHLKITILKKAELNCFGKY